jgi:hypothetical protein
VPGGRAFPRLAAGQMLDVSAAGSGRRTTAQTTCPRGHSGGDSVLSRVSARDQFTYGASAAQKPAMLPGFPLSGERRNPTPG